MKNNNFFLRLRLPFYVYSLFFFKLMNTFFRFSFFFVVVLLGTIYVGTGALLFSFISDKQRNTFLLLWWWWYFFLRLLTAHFSINNIHMVKRVRDFGWFVSFWAFDLANEQNKRFHFYWMISTSVQIRSIHFQCIRAWLRFQFSFTLYFDVLSQFANVQTYTYLTVASEDVECTSLKVRWTKLSEWVLACTNYM